VVGVKAGSQIVNVTTGLNTSITGTYGTLTVNAAGVAVYHSNPNSVTPPGASDVFTYTIRDGDGDLSTTTLTINIADSGLTTRTDSDVKVYENALDTSKDGIDLAGGTVTGSNPASTAETATGNLVDSTSGGTGPLTFALVGNATGTYGQIQVNSNGTYTYTLTSPVTNTPNGDNGANIALNETFTYSATDAVGNTINGTIQISIVDDVPTAKADTAQVTEGNTVTTNVLGNDTLGADGAVVVGVKAGSQIVNVTTGLNTSITGTYGTLTVNAAGVAVYHSNPNSVTPPGASDVFTYTIRDGDGDLSTTTLTISIADSGLTARTDSDVKVYENALDTSKDGIDLAGGTVTGSNPASTAETATGNLVDSTSGGTGPLTFALVGTATGTYGQIQVNSNGTYTYTLTSPVTNTPNGDNGANIALNEAFTYSATDAVGNTVTGTIQISIVDDVPTAKADTAQVAEGNSVTTNVLGNDTLGADGAVVVGVKAGGQIVNVDTGLNTSIAGTYGTLTVNAAGVAVYHSNPNAVTPSGASDVFTYTIRDGDGDLSTTTLTINIADSGLTARTDSDVKVYENALDTSKDGIDLAGGTVTGSNPSSTAETATGNLVDSTSGGTGPLTFALVGSATGTYGQIQVNSNGTYTYTLTSPVTNTPNGDNGANIALNETFTYSATDAVGNTVTGTIQISIVDDVPTAKADTAQVTEGNTVTTNVLGNDTLGADGAAVVGVKAGGQIVNIDTGLNTNIVGTYGTLTLNAAGVAVYHSNPNSVTPPGATDIFTYTIRDGDGDLSTTTLTINIADSGLTARTDSDVKVYENALDTSKDGIDLAGGTVTGSNPSSTAETATGNLVDSTSGGTGPLTFALVGSATGAYGQIQVNSNGTYTYTLTSPVTNTPNGDNGANIALNETFTYSATDTVGNTVNGTIQISIVDDVPTAKADTAQVAEGDTVTTNVLGNDTLGADGAAVIGVKAGSQTANVSTGLNTTITGTYGTLTLNAAGVAVYHSNPNSVTPPGASDVFTYTIRDGDGDLSTTTLTINVADSGLKAVPDGDITVYEKALDLSKDGQDLAAGTVIGSDPSNTGETASGTLVGAATGGTGPLTFALVGSATGSYGQILLNSNGTYTYTLTSPPKTSPSANDGPNVLTESFAYKATDALGNTVNSTIVISIVDDVPKAVASERSVTTVEVDSNLLLIIDVSGSMADASGVPGLSRLALAKQAISTLLDKYDDMGDVKVQVVTFSTNATDRTSTWVDIATAKTIVNGLTAGGNTNYDAAVATAQTAFGTSGKLVGAQNVGYFFSDGVPTAGQEIGTADETAWKAFLDANGIKSYAIGLGTGVNSAALNPLAYDGSTHTDTNSVVVTDLNQLNSVLAGTVQGAPVTGSLLTDGSFGADGGFVKSLVVGGITYTFDPTANSNQGGMTVAGGAGTGTFDTVSNSITITTGSGGTLIVDMDTGEYIYTPPKVSGVQVTENIGFVLVDNDGDLGGAQLVIKVNPNAAPVAGDDHVITNLLAANINVPAALLLANDTDPNGDPLNAAPTTFNTGWIARGAEFTGTTAVPGFAGPGNSSANQALTVARSAFTSNSAMMTAVAVVSGYLGAVNGAAANAQDVITLTLKQGETLTLDHSLAASHLAMEWQYVPTVGAATAYTAIADGGLFTALQDGTYRIHLTNLADAQVGNAAENYQLTMTVNYADAADSTPDYSGTYTANDSHGGSDSAAVSITYQAGHTLTGTSGDDVLLAAPGDNILNGNDGNDVLSVVSGTNSLYGGNGNDLLFSGSGNDLLDGGAGNDTVSYLNATAGVTVDLGHVGQQNTVGAGLDTLVSIENLIGSNYNDTLTGDNNANVLSGGLGNDTLIGGGGDDLLIGGMGNNTLTGGPGADTFQWLQGNSGHDLVTDFSLGTDKLDLAQLLQGENASSASLDDYLHFKVTGSGATLVSTIDISSVAGAAPTQTIDLAGVNLATHYGVTPGSGGVIAAGADTATIINGMLNDHSLKVDTV
jgi:VCBS repeat-containing protein